MGFEGEWEQMVNIDTNNKGEEKMELAIGVEPTTC